MNPPTTTPHHHIHASRRIVRRSVTLLAATAVIASTPLVARALDDEPSTTSDTELTSTPLAEGRLATRSDSTDRVADPIPDLGANLAADPGVVESIDAPATLAAEPADAPALVAPVVEAEPAVDPTIAALTDTYAWGERGPRVVALQEALGVTADGWYAHATEQAHRVALEALALPTDALPEPLTPAGPSPSQWAALRDCESGGNYAITNPSGKYRGAYQFDRSTWNSVAERHAPHLVGLDPAAASPADQDAMALALYGERGASPWPQCGRHLS